MLLQLLIVAVFVAVAVAVKAKLTSVDFSRVFYSRDCLTEHIRLATDPEVQCPHQEDDYACHATITGQEIHAVSSLKLETKGYLSGRSGRTTISPRLNIRFYFVKLQIHGGHLSVKNLS